MSNLNQDKDLTAIRALIADWRKAIETRDVAGIIAAYTPDSVLFDAIPPARTVGGEAIGQLDPEDDKHWTSNNLPALDVLESMTGKKVARSDVDAVAEGYTRAKARAAKQ